MKYIKTVLISILCLSLVAVWFLTPVYSSAAESTGTIDVTIPINNLFTLWSGSTIIYPTSGGSFEVYVDTNSWVFGMQYRNSIANLLSSVYINTSSYTFTAARFELNIYVEHDVMFDTPDTFEIASSNAFSFSNDESNGDSSWSFGPAYSGGYPTYLMYSQDGYSDTTDEFLINRPYSVTMGWDQAMSVTNLNSSNTFSFQIHNFFASGDPYVDLQFTVVSLKLYVDYQYSGTDYNDALKNERQDWDEYFAENPISFGTLPSFEIAAFWELTNDATNYASALFFPFVTPQYTTSLGDGLIPFDIMQLYINICCYVTIGTLVLDLLRGGKF